MKPQAEIGVTQVRPSVALESGRGLIRSLAAYPMISGALARWARVHKLSVP